MIIKKIIFLFAVILVLSCGGESDEKKTENNNTGGNSTNNAVVPVVINCYLQVGDSISLLNKLDVSKQVKDKLIWKSKDDSIAAIASDGLLTAICPGFVSVVAKTDDENIYLICDVAIPFIYELPDENYLKIVFTPDIDLSDRPCFPWGVNHELRKRPIPSKFAISQTEVTYKLWYFVYQWAIDENIDHDGDGVVGDDKYIFAHQGIEGSDCAEGTLPTDGNDEPVTGITWRDAIVWCNAFTEYYNAFNGELEDYKCVYYIDEGFTTPIRVSTNDRRVTVRTYGSQDCPYIYADTSGNNIYSLTNCTAKGFRLPSITEWEYAAKYRGSDPTNAVKGEDGSYYTNENSASGAESDDFDTNDQYAWSKYSNITKTQGVGLKKPNTLYIYDMSGNVSEHVHDISLFSSSANICRSIRGGNYNDDRVKILSESLLESNRRSGAVGFRIVRSD